MRYYIEIVDLGFESFVVAQDFCGSFTGMSDTRLGYKRVNKGLIKG